MEHCVYESGTGKLKYLNKACPSDNLSNTNPYGLSWGRTQAFKVTNTLSHGTAISNDVQWLVIETVLCTICSLYLSQYFMLL